MESGNTALTALDERVLLVLVGGHTLSRSGLRSLLAEESTFSVVAEAANRSETLSALEKWQPGVVLLDIDADPEHSVAMIPEMLTVSPSSKILILTGSSDRELHRRAVRAGSIGLVFKDAPPQTLLKAIERVHAGEVWLDRSLTASVLGELSQGGGKKNLNPEAARIASLTDREREVIAALGAGLSNRQIAQRLFISDVTVRHHLTSIYAKLEISSRLELIVYAYRNGLAHIPR